MIWGTVSRIPPPSLEQENPELTAFRIQALSRLTDQHEENARLRPVTASANNVHTLSSICH